MVIANVGDDCFSKNIKFVLDLNNESGIATATNSAIRENYKMKSARIFSYKYNDRILCLV